MARYPEDLIVDTTTAAVHEQARLEAQKVQSDLGLLGDPADNELMTIEATDLVTPAQVQQSYEVIARNTAATALSYPTSDSTDAEANIQTMKDRFDITEPAA